MEGGGGRRGSASADAGGSVTLAVERADGRAVLRVTNSGEPIDAEIMEKIFEPFFTTREKGTGLGLAFAREIALDHGGSLTVERGQAETSFALSVPTVA